MKEDIIDIIVGVLGLLFILTLVICYKEYAENMFPTVLVSILVVLLAGTILSGILNLKRR